MRLKASFKKYLLIALGSLSLGLGAVGVVVPVLPTTPFLLIALFCYLRSSRRLYDWLIHHRLFGTYLYNYVTYRAVPRQTKIGALIFLWAGLITSIILVDALFVRLILLAVGIVVSIHILSLKTITKEQQNAPNLQSVQEASPARVESAQEESTS